MLALGDALLLTYDRYTTAYRGRDKLVAKLLAEIDDLPNINLADQYPKALEYKFTPDAFPQELDDEVQAAMADDWGTVFLHVEQKRTGKHWPSIDDYIQWSGIREAAQHTSKKLLRNVVRNAQIKRCTWKYPREHLFRTLPVLLGITDTPSKDWPKESAYFVYLWERFN